MSPGTHPAGDGRGPWWRPDATDLGAMVGLCRCPSARDEQQAPARTGESQPGADATILAARLSGVLRAGC